MKKPNDSTVLGDFNQSRFVHKGDTFDFYHEGQNQEKQFFVKTLGPSGRVQSFLVKYTFGVEPLQQYLLETSNGKLQALTVVWDVEQKKWYSLQTGDRILHHDWLHWGQKAFNWNNMCASCHSTGLNKNYDAPTDSYHTTWSEKNVSCEACHGPGSKHVDWARASVFGRKWMEYQGLVHKGLAVPYTSSFQDDSTEILYSKKGQELEIQTCAPCHSRRSQVGESGDEDFSHAFFENHIPEVLREGVYHSDGQIQDEVYVYGSFIQSKMYHEGVRCTNCHDPHSLQLKAKGNNLCFQCHTPSYGSESHHRHPKNSSGAQCVNCHMPGKHYMGIDFRRDHSFRIPRPDLSVEYGTPNACIQCHTNKEDKWAAKWVDTWHGTERPYHYSQALSEGRRGNLDSLLALANNPNIPMLVRATVIHELGRYRSGLPNQGLRLWQQFLQDSHPFIRHMTLRQIRQLSPEQRRILVGWSLEDSSRIVRIEAAHALSDIPLEQLHSFQREVMPKAEEELVRYLRLNEDTPVGKGIYANYLEAKGDVREAEKAYKLSLAWDSLYSVSRMNLAFLYNRSGNNKAAEEQFREVILQGEGNWEIHYSLALLLAEEKRYSEATEYLEIAKKENPNNIRLLYNLGLAYQHQGMVKEAEVNYRAVLELEPTNLEALYVLVVLNLQAEQIGKAYEWYTQIQVLAPNDTRVLQLRRFFIRKP
jgi:predicted CXXCH cytochrome family protein